MSFLRRPQDSPLFRTGNRKQTSRDPPICLLWHYCMFFCQNTHTLLRSLELSIYLIFLAQENSKLIFQCGLLSARNFYVQHLYRSMKDSLMCALKSLHNINNVSENECNLNYCYLAFASKHHANSF